MTTERMIQAAVAQADMIACAAGPWALAALILAAGIMVLAIVATSRH